MMPADSNYSINPWMRPEVRPGDNVDPTPMLTPEQIFLQFEIQNPYPGRPGDWAPPRFTGMPRTQPGILDVLNIGPTTLMRDTETRQESGMQGTLRPATGTW